MAELERIQHGVATKASPTDKSIIAAEEPDEIDGAEEKDDDDDCFKASGVKPASAKASLRKTTAIVANALKKLLGMPSPAVYPEPPPASPSPADRVHRLISSLPQFSNLFSSCL